MSAVPQAIRREGEDQLVIEWSDGETRIYKAYELLKACPCANCAKQEQPDNALPMLKEEDNTAVHLIAMHPVGRYAYTLDFNVGCGNGIYTLEYLKTLGTVQSE